MIKSKEDYGFYLAADRLAKNIPNHVTFRAKLKNLLFPNPIWEFQKTLRILEYYTNCKQGFLNKIIRLYLSRKFQQRSIALGFTIPINTCGPGLSIAHYGTIIINEGARIGANCRLHCDVNIGTKAGKDYEAPTIGDNCYIAPGAKIYGKITIANNVVIGANAVVNKSFEEENIAIAGSPAKKIADFDTSSIIINAKELALIATKK